MSEAPSSLDDVLAFARVVELGSFTRAADRLGVQKSTVSRKVAALEERLGVRLLHRTTRKLNPTEAGAAYYARCARALSELEAAERAVADRHDTPRGTLRITAPVEFGFLFLGPVVAEYLRSWPDVHVELELSRRLVDLIEEGFDVALRGGPLDDSSLVSRRLATVGAICVASPDYVAGHAPIRRPADLAEHDVIQFNARGYVGRIDMTCQTQSVTVAVDGRLRVDNFTLARDAAIAGAGVAIMPRWFCSDALSDGRLAHVLPDWSGPQGHLSAVYPSRRYLSPKVRTFVDLVAERVTHLLDR